MFEYLGRRKKWEVRKSNKIWRSVHFGSIKVSELFCLSGCLFLVVERSNGGTCVKKEIISVKLKEEKGETMW